MDKVGKSKRFVARKRPDIALLLLFIRAWQKLISPFIGNHCRFHPTCSAYAAEALIEHGIFRGLAIAGRRLLRCNSLVPGGIDPVPPAPGIRTNGRERLNREHKLLLRH